MWGWLAGAMLYNLVYRHLFFKTLRSAVLPTVSSAIITNLRYFQTMWCGGFLIRNIVFNMMYLIPYRKPKIVVSSTETLITPPSSRVLIDMIRQKKQSLKSNPISSSSNQVSSLEACNFIKKSLQHRYFPVNIVKFLRTVFFTEHLQWLLLHLHMCWNEIGYEIGYDELVILKGNTKYTISKFLTEFKKKLKPLVTFKNSSRIRGKVYYLENFQYFKWVGKRLSEFK